MDEKLRSITKPDVYREVLYRVKKDSRGRESCRPFFCLFVLLSQYGLSSNCTIDMRVSAVEKVGDSLFIDAQKLNKQYGDLKFEVPAMIHQDMNYFISGKEPYEYVFTTSKGGRYYQQKFSTYISQLSVVLNIEDLNSQCLRALSGNARFWESFGDELVALEESNEQLKTSLPLEEQVECYKSVLKTQDISCHILENLSKNIYSSITLSWIKKEYEAIAVLQQRLLNDLEILNKKHNQ